MGKASSRGRWGRRRAEGGAGDSDAVFARETPQLQRRRASNQCAGGSSGEEYGRAASAGCRGARRVRDEAGSATRYAYGYAATLTCRPAPAAAAAAAAAGMYVYVCMYV